MMIPRRVNDMLYGQNFLIQLSGKLGNLKEAMLVTFCILYAYLLA